MGQNKRGGAARIDAAFATEIQEGVLLQQRGDLDRAESCYRKALDIHPDHPHVLHYMGALQFQRGNPEKAIELISLAIEKLPTHADCFANLGAAYYAVGDTTHAEQNFRRAIELNPQATEAYANLATVLIGKGENGAAADLLENAHRLAPNVAKYMKKLGDLSLEQEKFERASHWFEGYLGSVPDDAEVQNNLGYALERLGELERAERHYRRAAELAPDSPEINNNIGTILNRLGRRDEADRYFIKSINFAPERWTDLMHLAGALSNRRKFDQATAILERLIEEKGEDADLRYNLAIVHLQASRMTDAIAQFEAAIRLKPDMAEAYNNMAAALKSLNRDDENLAALRRAIELKAGYLDPILNICIALRNRDRYDEAYVYAKMAMSNENIHPVQFSSPSKIFRAVCDFDALEAMGDVWDISRAAPVSQQSANFLDMLVAADSMETVGKMVDIHKEWGRDYSDLAKGEPIERRDAGKRTGKIRLGFASPDLFSHAVARFVLPLFANIDRDRFEVFCYAPIDHPGDVLHERIKELSDHFYVGRDKSSRDIAQQISDDGVDILFELAGFTANSLIQVALYEPAPVQIEWLGYPFTTGLKQLDYILLDPYCAPENSEWLVEKPLLMPESWICFGNMMGDEKIADVVPVERNDGVVTFGTMNNPYKYTRQVFRAWAEVLHRVPNSRFLFVRHESRSSFFCKHVTEEFARNGIDPERIHFSSNRAHRVSNLTLYNNIDITLDTFPVTGGTTTCDALWMGVPIIAMAGPSVHQRLCYSLMENAGIAELCVTNWQDYVDLAVALANDTNAMKEYRYGLRPALLESPLCDAKRYTENFQNLMLEVVAKHGLR